LQTEELCPGIEGSCRYIV